MIAHEWVAGRACFEAALVQTLGALLAKLACSARTEVVPEAEVDTFVVLGRAAVDELPRHSGEALSIAFGCRRHWRDCSCIA